MIVDLDSGPSVHGVLKELYMALGCDCRSNGCTAIGLSHFGLHNTNISIIGALIRRKATAEVCILLALSLAHLRSQCADCS